MFSTNLLSAVGVLALSLVDTCNASPMIVSDSTLVKRAVYSGVNKACPAGYYPSGNTIPNKGKLCLPCSNFNRYAATCTPTGIVTCKAPGYLALSSNKNVCTTRCPSGTFGDTTKRICVACTTKDKNALTCSATTVTSCKSGFLSAGKCLTTCPSKTYADTQTKTCKACSDPSAVKCSALAATVCDSTTFLSAGNCVKTCPSGKYGSTRSRNCIDCGDGVATCDPVTGQAKTCDKKADGTQLYFDPVTKKCRTTCSDGVTSCEIDGTAKSCGTKSDGTKLYFTGTSCVATCLDGTYPESADFTCRPCDKNNGILTCTDFYTATSCGQNSGGANMFLEGGNCVYECDPSSGTFGKDGRCVECGDGVDLCWPDGAPRSCDVKADGTKLVYDDVNRACITEQVCEDKVGFYPSKSYCAQCSKSAEFPGASDCSKTGPTECLQSYKLENGACIATSVAFSKYAAYFNVMDDNTGFERFDQGRANLQVCAQAVRQSSGFAADRDAIYFFNAHAGDDSTNSCYRFKDIMKPYSVPIRDSANIETLVLGTCQDNAQYDYNGLPCENLDLPIV